MTTAPAAPPSLPPAYTPPARPVTPPPVAYAPPARPVAEPQAEEEPVIGVIPGLERSKGIMQTETFNLVVTPGRLVFALITQAMINAAVQQARADAKQQGAGMLGQVAAQMAWLDIVAKRCREMPVEATLAEQPGSFFIPNDQIRKVEIKPIDHRQYALVIQTRSGQYQFTLKSGKSPVETRELLQEVLGGVVK